jgi:hypothetical protein
VFNAYTELQDPGARSSDAPPPTSVLTTPRRAEPNAAEGVAASTIADVVAETAIAEADEREADGKSSGTAEDAPPISARRVDEVLTATVGAGPVDGSQSWSAFSTTPEHRSVSRAWSAAVVLALVALGAQALHYFRADIAGHATFGPLLQDAYALLGAELTPRWDVRQYEILDWVATAEPNDRGLGSLKITARIQNRGPLRQPYPAVQLRLKDRGDKAVSSRVFTPAEYLARESPRERLMAPGETTRAEMEVVDPGPDAYGFELDVCIEVEASLVTCGTDEVFL